MCTSKFAIFLVHLLINSPNLIQIEIKQRLAFTMHPKAMP